MDPLNGHFQLILSMCKCTFGGPEIRGVQKYELYGRLIPRISPPDMALRRPPTRVELKADDMEEYEEVI